MRSESGKWNECYDPGENDMRDWFDSNKRQQERKEKGGRQRCTAPRPPIVQRRHRTRRSARPDHGVVEVGEQARVELFDVGIERLGEVRERDIRAVG